MVHRRKYLAALGAAGAALVAGCSAADVPGSDDDSNGEGDPEPDDENGDSPADGEDNGDDENGENGDGDENGDETADPVAGIDALAVRATREDGEQVDVNVIGVGEALTVAVEYHVEDGEGTLEVTLEHVEGTDSASSGTEDVGPGSHETQLEVETDGLEGGPYEVVATLSVDGVTEQEIGTVTIVGSGAREQEAWRRLREARGYLERGLEIYREAGGGETILDTDASVEDFPRTDVVNTARKVHEPLDRAEVQRVGYLADDIAIVRLEAEYLVGLARLQDDAVKAHARARRVLDRIESGSLTIADRERDRLEEDVADLEAAHEALRERREEIEGSVRGETYLEKLDQLDAETDTLDRYAAAGEGLATGVDKADDARSSFDDEEYNLAIGFASRAIDAFEASIETLEDAPAETLSETTDAYVAFAEAEIEDLERLREQATEEAD